MVPELDALVWLEIWTGVSVLPEICGAEGHPVGIGELPKHVESWVFGIGRRGARVRAGGWVGGAELMESHDQLVRGAAEAGFSPEARPKSLGCLASSPG
jgi:hypothetical protein